MARSGVPRAATDRVDSFGRQMPDASMMYMGDPDGPKRFVKSLGVEVPTYISPRDDLRSSYNSGTAHKSVDYHVPPPMRGTYVPTDLADYDPGNHYALTGKLKVKCGGLIRDGQACQKSAMNRSGFCTNHGGALHPADKFYSSERGVAPTHVENLSRLDKIMLEIIPISELSDEEIARQMIRDDNGQWVRPSRKIAPKLYEMMHREMYQRANDLIRMNTLDMIQTMVDIAKSDVNEPADRQKAAQWLVERQLGKTPDVLITSKTEKPFEQLMADIQSGSREDFRREREAMFNGPVIEGEVVIIEEEDEDDDEAIDQDSVQDGAQTVQLAIESGESEEVDDEHTLDGSALSGASGFGNESQDGSHEDDGERNRQAQEGELTSDSNENKGGSDPLQRQAALAEKAREREEAKKRIMAARRRRFAAKSQGLDSVSNVAYGVEFKTEIKPDGTKQTRMKLIAPDAVKLPKTR